MKLFFVRHGQTLNNLNKLYTGQTDVALTDLGRQQAEDIRPVLAGFSFDRVYSSDLSRAMETQKLALPGYTAVTTPLLREMDLGSLEGQPFEAARTRDEAARKARDFSMFGGETGQQIRERVAQFLKLLEDDPCDYAVAFAHGGIMGAMVQLVLGAEADLQAITTGNCHIHVFEYDGKRWKLLAWNYMGTV